MPSKRYDVIILAGHGPKVADFVVESGQHSKALIPVNGQPMVGHVIRAMRASGYIKRLAIVGLQADEIILDLDCPVMFLPNQASMLDNMLCALDALGSEGAILSVSADIPLVTPEAIADFVRQSEATGADLCYPVVEETVMAARFPESGRSFRRIADGAFAGGDMMRFDADLPRRNKPLIESLTAQRKSMWGLIRVLGAGMIARYATGQLHLVDIERRVGHVLQCSARAIISPYAELAMDVDTAEQLQIAQRVLSARR